MSGIGYRFFDGPWENAQEPTLVRTNPTGGDPLILARLKVHRADDLHALCGAANVAPDLLAALKLTRERLRHALFLAADVIPWDERASFDAALKQADEVIAGAEQTPSTPMEAS